MIKITFVIPYEELRTTVTGYLQQVKRDRIQFSTTHLVGVEEVRSFQFDCDIVIARGITYAAIRELHPEITAIEIPVTGYDVIRALVDCRKQYKTRDVVIVASGNMIYGAPSLNEILDMDIQVYSVDTERAAESYLDQAAKKGVGAVIGGLMTYRFARQRGLPCTWIKSGPDAIKQSIDEAVRTAEIKLKERERAEFFKIVMDYAHEGVVSIDRKGTITAFNRSASTILKHENDPIGLPYMNVLPSTAIERALVEGKEDIGVLESWGDASIAANVVPMHLGTEIEGVVVTFQSVNRIQELESRIRRKIFLKGHTAKYNFQDILGTSFALMHAVRIAEKYSRVDANILITGETGTGKELFAHSIHNASTRANGPFVAVNCAALPEHLLESELFGYAEGAFTGAMRGGKAGLFEMAHGGTIFLDEIGEIPLSLQAKLLRVLQEREIMRVGDDRVIPVNVRVIAATNLNLREMSEKGRFRSDLLFRLDVLRIDVPPLRERQEDISFLARHYLNLFSEKFGKRKILLELEAEKYLGTYPWPGNVRELVNLCERIAALSEGEVISREEIQVLLGKQKDALKTDPVSMKSPGEGEQLTLLEALRRAKFNQSHAAKLLGISRTTLWRKLRSLESVEMNPIDGFSPADNVNG
jgi:transcriptional regulator with PAS, ATPase and Fis domain